MVDSVNHTNDDLPYRPCVGVLVFNTQGLVFVGQRSGAEKSVHSWQMPQGGIDDGESPEAAARRELVEETSISSVELLGESRDWLDYDLPPDARGRWAGRYRGQTQKWFAYRFSGDDSEINLDAHSPAEFSDWRWVALDQVAALIVPFKRSVYEALVDEFSALAVPL